MVAHHPAVLAVHRLERAVVGFGSFAYYRFLTGLGVGGQFAVGVSLVAEEMPDRARPFALGMLQALSAVGNIAAGTASAWRSRSSSVPASIGGVLARHVRHRHRAGPARAASSCAGCKSRKAGGPWRPRRRMRERLGAYTGELFSDPRWSSNALVGLVLASSGIIGLWAIGFFTIDLQSRAIIRQPRLEAAGPWPRTDVTFREDIWASITSVVLNLGAFFGIYAFSRVTTAWAAGRHSHLLRAGPGQHGVGLLEARQRRRYLLDDPAHGLLPARAVRRLRDLLPGTVPHPAAQHRHIVLLQRRPLRGRRRLRPCRGSCSGTLWSYTAATVYWPSATPAS